MFVISISCDQSSRSIRAAILTYGTLHLEFLGTRCVRGGTSPVPDHAFSKKKKTPHPRRRRFFEKIRIGFHPNSLGKTKGFRNNVDIACDMICLFVLLFPVISVYISLERFVSFSPTVEKTKSELQI